MTRKKQPPQADPTAWHRALMHAAAAQYRYEDAKQSGDAQKRADALKELQAAREREREEKARYEQEQYRLSGQQERDETEKRIAEQTERARIEQEARERAIRNGNLI